MKFDTAFVGIFTRLTQPLQYQSTDYLVLLYLSFIVCTSIEVIYYRNRHDLQTIKTESLVSVSSAD